MPITIMTLCSCRNVATGERGCRFAQTFSGAGTKKISRTSTAPPPNLAALRAHASASFVSTHSSIEKPPTCSLASRYRPVRDEHFTVGLRAQRVRRAQAAGKLRHAGSVHFSVQRVNPFHRRFVHRGRVKVVGGNQIPDIAACRLLKLVFSRASCPPSL